MGPGDGGGDGNGGGQGMGRMLFETAKTAFGPAPAGANCTIPGCHATGGARPDLVNATHEGLRNNTRVKQILGSQQAWAGIGAHNGRSFFNGTQAQQVNAWIAATNN